MARVTPKQVQPDPDLAARAEQVEALAGEVLHQIRVDPRAALAVADRMASLAGNDPRLNARAIWSRAHALVNLGRHAEASEHYARAAAAYRRLGDSSTAARTALGHVDALMFCGRYGEAMKIGKAARSVLMRHRDLRSVVRLDANLANILHRTDRAAEALRAYDRARRMAKSLNDEHFCCLLEYSRANVLTSLGRHAEAEAAYTTAGVAAESSGESRIVALVKYSLGYLKLQSSDYGEAYDALNTARQAFDEIGDSYHLGLCHLDLAELLLEINAFVRARHQARQARVIFEQLGLRYESSKATLFMAVAELGQGEDARARALIVEAAQGFRREGNAVSAAVCDLYRGELARRAGRQRVAEGAFERAERCFSGEKLNMRAAAAALRRTSLAMGRGDATLAADHLLRARSQLARRNSPWLLAQHDHLTGRMHWLEGDAGQARRHIRRAVKRIERVRQRITLDEFRVSYAADKAPIYGDLIDLTLTSRPSSQAVSEAFAIVEQARSRALVDLLAGRLGPAAVRGDTASQQILRRIETLRGEINWYSGTGEGEHGRRDERLRSGAQAAIRSREAEIADLMQRLAHSDSRLGALTVGETITIEEVQTVLAADTALVEYFLSGGAARAFVVTREEARVVKLPASPADIAAGLERLRFQIEKWGYGDDYGRGRTALMEQSVRAHLDRLADMVWRPLGVETSHVLCVPHGPLHSLPFYALPAEDASKDSLVDRIEITCLPSASTLRYLRDGNSNGIPDRNAESVLVVGMEDERIPRVEDEIERVRGLFSRGHVLKSADARIAEFRSRAAEADYLHVAAHGIFREDDPHFSALKLADGWLSVYDLYGLDLKARLVSLSACQSGRSWVGGGDELVGLVRGFLHAGARSLVVSLWPVYDATTADFMVGFYQALRAGTPAATAMRNAMVAVREEHPHPYHWAPFILIGPGECLSVSPRSKNGSATAA